MKQNKNRIPQFPFLLLKQLYAFSDGDCYSGDIQEEFDEIMQSEGKRKAHSWIWVNAIRAIPSTMKSQLIWGGSMFKNHTKVAIRNIRRHKGYSFINIMGLAVGIACCLLIFLYLQNELTYDKYHENSHRIYRISSTYITSGEPIRFAVASPALGSRLKAEYPEVEAFVRTVPIPQILFHQVERDFTFYEQHLLAADPDYFTLFTYDFISGDPQTCLAEPNSIVLTEEFATKYYGSNDPMGKILQTGDGRDLKVTGLIKNPPQNSHVPVRGVVSFSTWDTEGRLADWPLFEVVGFTYVLLPDNYDFTHFWDRWPPFYEKYCAEDGERYGQTYVPNFIPLEDIRYGSMRFRFDVDKGSWSYLYAFIAIGIFILVLACINTINMTTAHAATRAKEVGIKKVLGSGRKNLIFQILGESAFISLIAFVVGFILLQLFIMSFPVEQWLDFKVGMNIFQNPLLLFSAIGLFIFISIASGLYPAFYITAVMPIKVLTGTFKSGRKGLFIRRTLVTAQFAISIGVIVLMLFMNNQVNFMRNRDLGFKKENVVSIPIRDRNMWTNIPAIEDELMKSPNILSAATGDSRPGAAGTGLYSFEGVEGMEEHNFHVFAVGFNYVPTLGLEIISGRDFQEAHTTDRTQAVIVNETLVKEMGWEDPIGKRITQGNNFEAQVIGVVKDFNFQSLHNQIQPLLMRMQGQNSGRLFLKIRGENIRQSMAFIEEKWKEFSPNRPFEYDFLDEEFGRLYNADQRLNKLVLLFSAICVFISCLGVLGLSSFNAIRRTKEMAIRKVHGASSPRLVIALFKEIFLLFSVAAIIVLPVSYFLIDLWLKNFAYRTTFNILLFIMTTLVGIVIAFLTAGYHCMKVAGANPITSIRYE